MRKDLRQGKTDNENGVLKDGRDRTEVVVVWGSGRNDKDAW